MFPSQQQQTVLAVIAVLLPPPPPKWNILMAICVWLPLLLFYFQGRLFQCLSVFLFALSALVWWCVLWLPVWVCVCVRLSSVFFLRTGCEGVPRALLWRPQNICQQQQRRSQSRHFCGLFPFPPPSYPLLFAKCFAFEQQHSTGN